MLEDLYREVYPEMFPETIASAGQLFIRDAGDGLCMVCGILVLPKKLPVETVYPVSVQLYYKQGEDVSELSEGQGLGSMVMQPIWRVKRDN